MARKPDEFMPFNVRKYLGDTMGLTRDQHGAYMLLLMAYWMRGGPLPSNDNELAAIVKASTSEWRKLRPVLAPFFTDAGGKWTQKRAEEELARARNLTEKKAASGKIGAERRWQTDGKRMAQPLANEKQSGSQTDAPLPRQRQKEEQETKKEAVPAFDLPADIPVEPFKDFVEMRVKIRKPMTDKAKSNLVGKLRKLAAAGEDIAAVLDQSVTASWTDVYAVKPEGNRSNGDKPASKSFGSSIGRVIESRAERGFAFEAGGGDSGAPDALEDQGSPGDGNPQLRLTTQA